MPIAAVIPSFRWARYGAQAALLPQVISHLSIRLDLAASIVWTAELQLIEKLARESMHGLELTAALVGTLIFSQLDASRTERGVTRFTVDRIIDNHQANAADELFVDFSAWLHRIVH